MKKNILFRTSGGTAKKKQLGLGHVFRCKNFAEYLNSHNLHFLIEDFGGSKDVLMKRKYKIKILPKNLDYNTDIKLTTDYIKKNKIDLIIIDNYNIKPKYVKKIKKFAKTVVISDLTKIDIPSDILINGYIGFENKIFNNKYGTKCFFGPSYQILNKKFLDIQKLKKPAIKLLVTFGGFDENNLASMIIHCLKKFEPKFKTKIISGPASIDKNLMKIDKKFSRKVKIIKQTNNMSKEILNCKYGICSGGITSYEFASLGKPIAIICQNYHQIKTASKWESKGFAKNLGIANKNTPKKIYRFLENIEKNSLKSNTTKINVGNGIYQILREVLC